MRIYVAGPMRGRANFNFPAFHEAAGRLRGWGHVVFSPAERDLDAVGDIFSGTRGDLSEIPQFSLRDALAADVVWIALNADAVAVLDGWEDSKGAQAEVALARALGLLVAPVDHFRECEA